MDTRILKVETFRVDYPVAAFFKFFEQPGGRPPARPTIVVRITADNGAVGWGQSVPSPRWSYETPETVETTIRRYLAPTLIGADPSNIGALHAEMNRVIAPSFSTGQPIAKAGIDLALHDLVCRSSGKSLADRWKRAPGQPVALSWTINVSSLDEVGPQVELAKDRGYQSFNIKVAPDVNFDLDVCRLVRDLAPDAFLWADANGGYDEPTAMQAATRFPALGIAALEQPLPANRLSGYQRLHQHGAIPIVMDEGIVSRVDLQEFLSWKLLDGIAMKVARCGGLSEAAAIMELAQGEGLLILGSGLTDPDLALAASLALFSAYGLHFPAALNAPQFLTTSILKLPLAIKDGAIAVPEGSGLGVEVDEAALRRYAVG